MQHKSYIYITYSLVFSLYDVIIMIITITLFIYVCLHKWISLPKRGSKLFFKKPGTKQNRYNYLQSSKYSLTHKFSAIVYSVCLAFHSTPVPSARPMHVIRLRVNTFIISYGNKCSFPRDAELLIYVLLDHLTLGLC